MYVWQNSNQRHRRIGRNGQCTLPAELESNKTTAEVSHYETQEQNEAIRLAMEEREVSDSQNMVSDLIESYLNGEGSVELAEVTENLKVIKEAERGPSISSTPTGTDKLKSRALERKERRAREIFSAFDSDGSGFVDKDEMRQILKDMSVPMSELQLDDLMQNMDADGSGEVDFEEFWGWYAGNAQAGKLGALGSTTRLFVSKIYNSMVGGRSQKEAKRVILAHSIHVISKLKRKAFRRVRPPPFECSTCGKPFALEVELKNHLVDSETQASHGALLSNEAAAAKRFLPIAALLDSNVGQSKGASELPHRSLTVSQERRKRLRRLMFNQAFIALDEQQYNAESSILTTYAKTMGVTSGKLAAYSISPMLEDPDDVRGNQLRRGQCVEGFDPSNRNAKVEAPRSRGGLNIYSQSIKPCSNTVQRKKGNKLFENILQRLMMHQDPTLGAEQCSVWRMKPDETMDGRGKVIFKLDGECKGPTLLYGEFNGWQGEIMPDRVIYTGNESVGSEIVKKLPPGVHQYYMEREGKRWVDDKHPVVPLLNDKGGVSNLLLVVWPPDEATSEQVGSLTHTSDDVSLESIQLLGLQICDDGMQALAAVLRGTSLVKSLDLSFNSISSRGIEDLCEAVSKSGSLVHLNLSQNGFGLGGSRSLACALRVCQRLVRIDLSETRLGDDGVSALSIGLVGHGSLSELNLRNALKSDAMRYLAEALSRNNSLENLHLSCNPLGPVGFLELSRAVSKTESIKSLSVAACQAMEQDSYIGFYNFCSQLCLNRSIITLDLQDNNISEYGSQESKELAHALQKQKALQNVILLDNPIPEQWLKVEDQVETGPYGFLPTITSSLQRNIKNEIRETPRERREAKLKARNDRAALRRNRNNESNTKSRVEMEGAVTAAALGSVVSPKAAGNGRQKKRNNDNLNRYGHWTSRRVWKAERGKDANRAMDYLDFYTEDGISVNVKTREKEHNTVNEEIADNASKAAVEKCRSDIAEGKDGWPEVCRNLSQHIAHIKRSGNWPTLLPLSQKRDLVQCCKLKELYKKQNMIEKEKYEELLQIFGDRSWTVLLQEVEKELRITIDRILQKKNIDGVQLPSNILHQLTNAREEAFQWACDIHIFASKCPEDVQGSTVNAKHKGNVIRRDIVHRVVLYAEQFATCEEESYRLCWHAFSTFDPMGTGFMEAQHLSHTLFLLNISWWEDVEGLVAELTSKLVDESSKPSPRRFMKEDEARADAAKLFGVKTTQGIVRFSAFVEWYVNYTVNNQNINNPKMESNRIAPNSTMKQHSNEALHKHMATLINEEGIRVALSVIARESREYTASCLVGTQSLRVCTICREVSFSSQKKKLKHEANSLFHEALHSMVHRYELLSSNMALSFRRINEFTFPDYYEMYPSKKKEENELQVYEGPDEDSRPLCVITEGILFEGLEQKDEWMKINHSHYKGVWVRNRSSSTSSKKNGRLLVKRMELSWDKTYSENKTRFGKNMYAAFRRRSDTAHGEPVTVSDDGAMYHPRVKQLRDIGVPYTLCKDVPEKTRLKVRARPEADAAVLGMISHGSGIIARAIAGDWIQVQFEDTLVAWMLRRYRSKVLLEPTEHFRFSHNSKSPFKLAFPSSYAIS